MRTSLGQAAEVLLGRQRAPQYEVGNHVVPYLRSANVIDGSLDLRDVKEMNFTPAEQNLFSLRPGDVLVTEGSGSRETVGVSAVWSGELPEPVCFQNTLLRLRPRAGLTEGRFLAWWMRHARISGQVASVSSGANILHIGSDGLKRLTLNVPTLDKQRRIADFLDDRVARIGQIIAARQRQVNALREHRSARLVETIFHPDDAMTQCARVAEVQLGRQRSPQTETGDNMIPYIRSANVTDGHIGLEDVKTMNFTPTEQSIFRLRFGDVLVTEAAGSAHAIGAAARWTLDNEAVYGYQNHLLRLRARPGHSPRFLELWARASHAQGVARAFATGASILNLGTEAMKKMPIPRIDLTDENARAREGEDVLVEHDRAIDALAAESTLLNEYKQSLITAAVTGEFDVTTATTKIPEF